jgi:hypothetical protein
MQPFIEIVAGEPDPGDKDQLLNILRGYNAQWTAHIADRPHLAILARSKEGGDVIGGLFLPVTNTTGCSSSIWSCRKSFGAWGSARA